MMRIAMPGLRLALPFLAGLLLSLAIVSLGQAAEPSAAGLWQKMENGRTVGWFLIIDHHGIFEGVIAKTFPQPRDDPNKTSASSPDDPNDPPCLGFPLLIHI